VSRSLAMLDRYRGGEVPEAEADPALAEGDDGLAGVDRVVCDLLDRAALSQALDAIWARVRRLNRYVEESRPWDLAKDDGQAGELDRVLYNLAEGVRVVALLLLAYMPETSERLLAALDEPQRGVAVFGSRPGGWHTGRIEPLFPKIESAV
jgi:methionyl-tRNA synthetase